MKKINFIVKVFILLKSVLAVLLLTSILALASELWTTRNQIEGRELVNAEPKGLASQCKLPHSPATGFRVTNHLNC